MVMQNPLRLRIIGFYQELRDLHLRYRGQVRVVVGTPIVDQQSGKTLVEVVVEEIQTQVPKVKLAVVHQIQLQKLRLK